MLQNILNLDGSVQLSKDQQKTIVGGGGAGSCKVTCKDGSLVGVSGCSDGEAACSNSGGAESCNCDYPGPFDPPPFIEA